MIIYDILAYGLKREKYKPSEIDLMIKEIANSFNITHLLTRKPNQLSIGQKQLVLIAKCLIKKPEICLLDEPFSNLDQNSILMCIRLITKYMETNQTTLVITTHNLKEVLPICEFLCSIKDGQCEYCGEFELAPKRILEEYGIIYERK